MQKFLKRPFRAQPPKPAPAVAVPPAASSRARASMSEKPDIRSYKLSDRVKLYLAQGDLTKFQGDAIVNAANEGGIGGGGVDGAIHRAAGPTLRKFCMAMPLVTGTNSVRIPTGKAVATRGFELEADIIIHTVGPVYHNDDESAPLLASAYRSSLEVADFYEVRRMAFPAISCGIFGYPHGKAARIALNECKKAASSMRDLEEIWFAFFEKPVYTAFINAAEELLEPVTSADTSPEASSGSAAPADATPSAPTDVDMAESSAKVAGGSEAAQAASLASGPTTSQAAPQAMPATSEQAPARPPLQDQVQAAMASQQPATPSGTGPSASASDPVDTKYNLALNAAEQAGAAQVLRPGPADQDWPLVSNPSANMLVDKPLAPIADPGSGDGLASHIAPPDASKTTQVMDHEWTGGVPKGTVAGLLHGQPAQEGVSALGKVTGPGGSSPMAEPTTAAMEGPGELKTWEADKLSPARSSAAAALSSAEGFPGHSSGL